MKLRTYLSFCLALAAVGQFCGCASDSPPPQITYAGGGPNPTPTGNMIKVDGIAIWQNGIPRQDYKIVSTIETQRVSDVSPDNTIFHSLAEKAKKAGGNGVIILSNEIVSTGGQDVDPSYNTSTPPAVVDSTTTSTQAQIIRFTPQAAAPEPKPQKK